MQISFYIFSGDNRLANKRNALQRLTTQYGTLRYPASIINPTIRIDVSRFKDTQGLWEDFIVKCNYFYIPEFARSYFITSKILDNDNIVTITGHVDVLQTYYDDYIELEAYVLRSGNNYNLFLEDNLISFERKPEITEWIPTNDSVNYPIVELSWDNEDSTPDLNDFKLHTKDLRYAITHYQNRNYSYFTHNSLVPFVSGSDLPSYSPDNLDCFYKGRNIHITSHKGLDKLFESILANPDTVASYIASIVVFPFPLIIRYDGSDYVIDATHGIDFGGSGGDGVTVTLPVTYPGIYYESGYGECKFNSPYILISVFNFTQPTAFFDLEPYTSYELYLPFVGYVNIPSIKLLNKRIWVYLSVNYSTGNGTVNVYATDKNTVSDWTSNLVFTQSCQIGLNIPIGRSNQEEIDRNKKSIAISTSISAVGSLLTMAMGALSQNPMAVAGGAMGIVNAVGGASSSLALLASQGNSPTSSEIVSFGTSLKVKIRKTRLVPTVSYYDYTRSFKEKHGLPVKQIAKLSTFSGLTIVDESTIILNDLVAMDEEKEELRSLLSSGVIL